MKQSKCQFEGRIFFFFSGGQTESERERENKSKNQINQTKEKRLQTLVSH